MSVGENENVLDTMLIPHDCIEMKKNAIDSSTRAKVGPGAQSTSVYADLSFISFLIIFFWNILKAEFIVLTS